MIKTYSVENDIASHQCDITRLHTEIAASVPEFVNVNRIGDVLNVVLNSKLDDYTLLNNIVTNHTPFQSMFNISKFRHVMFVHADHNVSVDNDYVSVKKFCYLGYSTLRSILIRSSITGDLTTFDIKITNLDSNQVLYRGTHSVNAKGVYVINTFENAEGEGLLDIQIQKKSPSSTIQIEEIQVFLT